MTRKWIMRALCILCLAAMLTGCGREPEVTETTIEVKKNGQVVHTIIEDFSESYYNLDELESTIQQACDTYNASAGKEAVVLKAAKENDDHTVTVVMQYADASAYSAFNDLHDRTGMEAENPADMVSHGRLFRDNGFSRQAVAADGTVFADDRILRRLSLPLHGIPVQLRDCGDDGHRHSDRRGLTGVRHLSVRRFQRADASGDVSVVVVGYSLVLAGGIHLSDNCHGSRVGAFGSLVSAAPLLSALCKSGIERLSDRLRMAVGCRIAAFHHAAACGKSPLSGRISQISL